MVPIFGTLLSSMVLISFSFIQSETYTFSIILVHDSTKLVHNQNPLKIIIILTCISFPISFIYIFIFILFHYFIFNLILSLFLFLFFIFIFIVFFSPVHTVSRVLDTTPSLIRPEPSLILPRIQRMR